MSSPIRVAVGVAGFLRLMMVLVTANMLVRHLSRPEAATETVAPSEHYTL